MTLAELFDHTGHHQGRNTLVLVGIILAVLLTAWLFSGRSNR